MTQRTSTEIPETTKSNQRLAILLAMAMFVLVVDTSLMNVSISAVVHDIGTTASLTAIIVFWAEEGRKAAPERHHPTGVRDLDDRIGAAYPGRARADSGWWLVIPLMIAGCGLPAGVPTQQLHALPDLR